MRGLNKHYTLVILPFVILLSLAHIWFSGTILFDTVNPAHRPWSDGFFTGITHLGNTVILGSVCIVFLGWRKEGRGARLLALVITILVCTLVVILAKHGVWVEAPRPLSVFGAEQLDMVPGIRTHYRNSFPSGHTASAVALLFVLAAFAPLRLRYGLALLALAIGYSRIYLNQHFVIDVTAGALVGLISGSTGIWLAQAWRMRRKVAPGYCTGTDTQH